MRSFFIAVLFVVVSATTFAQNPALGEFYGVVNTTQGAFTLVVRITDTNGTFVGSLEALEQAPGQMIPLAAVQADNSSLSFSVPAIGASYQGEWSASADRWTGIFTQQIQFPLELQRGTPPGLAIIEGMDGDWHGILKRNEVDLRLVLHVKTDARGTLVTFDSPDLSSFGLPVAGFTRAGSAVSFSVPAGQSQFNGSVAEDGAAMTGAWTRQGQEDVTVQFIRANPSAMPQAQARPQLPQPPFNYHVEEIVFENSQADGVTLAGTLTVPHGKGPFPAAVLISGSGAQDRDETLFGHKPFAVLADHLTRNGVVVLRYDDRGFAESTGDHDTATSADFATDANAALHYLTQRVEIDQDAIGFIGHSEGAMIAPLAAIESDHIAYIIMLAGPGTSTRQLIETQRRLLGVSTGVTIAELDGGEPVVQAINDAVIASTDQTDAEARVRAVLTPNALAALGVPFDQLELRVQLYTRAWNRYFLKYDPRPVLAQLKMPVLALNGTLDLQVPADENLTAIMAALSTNSDATAIKLEGLNHLFQTAPTGALGEYPDITETFAPAALDAIIDWVSARFF